MTIRQAFDAVAERYDGERRLLIPCFDEFYRAVTDLTPRRADEAFHFLDLGAGTGLLTAFLLEAFPRARATLVDIAPNMLDRAWERFAGSDRVDLVPLDYARHDLPGGFQLVASALSIHHLEDEEKRQLFAKAFHALEPGGTFVNADQVRGATETLERRYREHWLAHVTTSGLGRSELAAALDRTRYDRMADLPSQLQWLEEAGFTDVDCAYRNFSFVVYSGRRP